MRRFISWAVPILMVLGLGVVLAAPAPATGATYYVSSTAGSDANSGTSTAPFRTIRKCARVAAAGDTCRIHAGTYGETVTPAHSGTSTAPVTFAAYGDGTATVTGADEVSKSAWRKATASDVGKEVLPALSTAVSGGHLYKAKVSMNADTSTDQVFMDGSMANIAQYPAPGSNVSHSVLATASKTTDKTITGKSLTQATGYWNGTKIWTNQWFVSRTDTVSSYTAKAGGGTIMLAGAPYSSVPLTDRHQVRYRLYDSLKAMSAAGQWAYANKTLYLWAPKGDSPSKHTVMTKARTSAFDLSGRSHVTVHGLSLFASTVTTNSTTSHATLNGLDVRYVSHYTDIGTKGPIASVGGATSGIILAGSGNTLENSEIAYSAGNGVAVGGSGDKVTHNYIHDTDYTGTYAAGINVVGQDATVTNNTVSVSGRSAVNIGTYPIVAPRPRVRIAYNDLSGTGYLSADQAPIYACCRKAGLDMKGSRLDHNWIHDDHQDAKRQVFYGIYLDNGTSNAQVDHNAIWHMSGGHGVGVNGGTKNEVVNNTELPNGYIHGSSTSNNTDLNNLSVNSSATFVDSANGNYQLLPTAAAINAGKADPPITDGYVGSAPDLGAYEYGERWTAGWHSVR